MPTRLPDPPIVMAFPHPQPPKYVMLNDQGSLRPPPHRRNIPRYHSHKSGSGGCCLKCICCCYCALFLLIFVLFGVSLFLYAVYKPQKPSYKVDHVAVNSFNIQPDLSLFTEFAVSVKADNPNEHIGFIYGKESSMVVIYSGKVLSSGKLPAFHQTSKNITVMNIVLKGKNEFGSGLQDSLVKAQKAKQIPLLIMVRVPISVVMGDFPLRQVVVFVNCSLVIDNLSPKEKIQIVSSKYDYDITL